MTKRRRVGTARPYKAGIAWDREFRLSSARGREFSNPGYVLSAGKRGKGRARAREKIAIDRFPTDGREMFIQRN